MLGIDGKILQIKELGFIEKMLFDEVLNPDQFYADIAHMFKDNFPDLARKEFFTVNELEKVDSFIREYLSSRINESKVWLLRAYIVGRYLAYSDIAGKIFNIGNISKLPQFAQDAAQRYGLSMEEALSLVRAVEEGASLMTNTTQSTIQTVRNVLIEETKQRGSAGGVLEAVKEQITNADIGEINRDWKRVAITEVNNIFNNAYLAALSDGDYVVGISMPDACGTCLDLIGGKVYKVRKTPPPDYSTIDPKDPRYNEIAEIWKNEVWAGKNNYGRSASRRKRIDPNVGNKEDNLREKHHHEHSMPACPNHPNCRCRWAKFNPQYEWVDGNGQLRLRAEDEDAWEIFYNENISGARK